MRHTSIFLGQMSDENEKDLTSVLEETTSEVLETKTEGYERPEVIEEKEELKKQKVQEKKELSPFEIFLSEGLWLSIVMILALFPRLVFLNASGFGIESDEAIVGLMAKHILEEGVRPVFYYGQNYLGALEAYLVAGAFRVWGVSQEVLKLVPTAISLLFVLLTYFLALQFTTRYGAKVASLLVAICPQSLMIWSTKARGGFIELLVIGSLSLIITVSIWKKPTTWKLILLGLVLGLGWWVNNQIIFYMAAIGFLLLCFFLLKEGIWSTLGALFVGLIFFFIGGFPFWQSNIFEEPKFASFETLFGQTVSSEGAQGQEETPIDALERVFDVGEKQARGLIETSLPILVGSRRFWSKQDIFPQATNVAKILYGITFLLVLLATLGGKFLSINRGPLSLVFLFFFMIATVFSLSSFGWLSQAPRYLLPVYSLLFVFVGIAAALLRKFLGRTLAGLFVFAFLSLHLASNYVQRPENSWKNLRWGVPVPGEPFVHDQDRVQTDHSQLINWLDTNEIDHVFTNYWIGYRLAFETSEKVTFSRFGAPRSLRIPEYENLDSLDRLERTYVVVASQLKKLVTYLRDRGIYYETFEVGEYFVVRAEEFSNIKERILEPGAYIISSNVGEGFLDKINDSELGTRWRSGKSQSPGMEITLDFDTTLQTISGMDIDLGFWPQDKAKLLRIEGKLLDGSWCTLFEAEPDNRRKMSLYFGNQTLRAIRLTNLESDEVLDWSIAELTLYK